MGCSSTLGRWRFLPAVSSSPSSSFTLIMIVVVLSIFVVVETFEARVGGEDEAAGTNETGSSDKPESNLLKDRSMAASSNRMLLQSDDYGDSGAMNGIGQSCSRNDIEINQAPSAPMYTGIPTYLVEIVNVCPTDCAISDIHAHCGWFSSATVVNPQVFRRIYYDDCLVNNGDPLGPGETLSFTYANTFHYPMSVSSVDCN